MAKKKVSGSLKLILLSTAVIALALALLNMGTVLDSRSSAATCINGTCAFNCKEIGATGGVCVSGICKCNSVVPTKKPTVAPTINPTVRPTIKPTAVLTNKPAGSCAVGYHCGGSATIYLNDGCNSTWNVGNPNSPPACGQHNHPQTFTCDSNCSFGYMPINCNNCREQQGAMRYGNCCVKN
jgi:hypothetical protein